MFIYSLHKIAIIEMQINNWEVNDVQTLVSVWAEDTFMWEFST